MNTNINNCFQNTDIWQPILWQSTPIVIRALSVTSKTLNKATALFKIDLVLTNKDLKFKPSYGIECRVFNEKIITQITDKNKGLDEKICALKYYMDVDNFGSKRLLHISVSPFLEEYSILDFLLKLCPNLDALSNSDCSTLLFDACAVKFNKIPFKMLLDAGADWRIKGPDGNDVFTPSEFERLRLEKAKEEAVQRMKLIAYAQGYWKQLNRENTPIPSRTFTCG